MADAEDVPPILLPCAICARTFKPLSLEKHTRICERAAAKKRKPFDSAKQRIQGTELAEFLPKQERRRAPQEDRSSKPRSSWKQTHDEFLRAIRAARGEVVELPPSYRHGGNVVPTGAPTRANEKGTCPTCNRQFGIKAYDRHVAWCKERAHRLPVSPATNVAKERLEARMKYRAPALKNRRPTNREKYSPGSAINLCASNKASLPANAAKAKESASVPSCNKGNESPVKPKPAVVRRPGQNRDTPTSSGAMKSRLIDRTNRQPQDREPGPATSLSPRPTPRRHSQLPTFERCKSFKSRNSTSSPSPPKNTRQFDTHLPVDRIYRRIDEQRIRDDRSARSQRISLISARGYDHPKLNDVAVNDEVVGMTVQPCNIHPDEDRNVVTWKQISDDKKDYSRRGSRGKSSARTGSVDGSVNPSSASSARRSHESREECDVPLGRKEIAGSEANGETRTTVTWASNIRKLDQTYLIKESLDKDVDFADVPPVVEWRPVENSPRAGFGIKNAEKAGESSDDGQFNLDSPTCFDVNVHFTSTPMPSLEDDVAGSTEFEGTGWSGGLKLTKPDPLELGFLESEPSKSQESSNSPRSEVTSPRKRKKKIVVKSTPRLKPVPVVETGHDEPLNYKQRENDCGTPKSGTFICAKEESSGPRMQRETKVQTTLPRGKKKSKSKHSGEEENLRDSPTVSTGTCEKVRRGEIVSESFARSFSARSSTAKSTSSSSREITENSNGSLEDNFATLRNDGRISSSTEDSNNTKLEESPCSFNSTDSLNNKSVHSPAPLQLYKKNKQSSNPDLSFHEEENLKCELSVVPKEKSSQTEIGEGHDANDKSQVEQEVNKSCDSSKEDSSASPESATRVYMRRRCGTYVIENTSTFPSSKQHVSEESPDERPSQKRRRVDSVDAEEEIKDKISTEECNDKNISLGSTILSRTLFDSTNEAEVTIDGDVHRVYEKYVNDNFDYDSDNTLGDHLSKEADVSDSFSTPPKNSDGEERLPNELQQTKAFSEPRVKLQQRSNKPEVSPKRASPKDMQRRLCRNMNILRGSTDTLISSVEAVQPSRKHPISTAESFETEICTLEVIRPGSGQTVYRLLPEIHGEPTNAIAKDAYERSTVKSKEGRSSYWEKASKISKNRLITLDPPAGDFKLAKRNPKIHLLPPMAPVDTDRRSGTAKDYDPFAMAERQMNELFSDNSDQSLTDSPPPVGHDSSAASSDAHFPLSHSSAFVKYPGSHSPPNNNKRASVIAPPSEFDDFVSDFSSDSTETNSLSRDIFINDLTSQTREIEPSCDQKPTGGGTTNNIATTATTTTNEATRHQVVMDKSKSQTGNNSSSNASRGKTFIGSAEKSRKILEKVTPKAARPVVTRSQSVRASSAPKVPERKGSSLSSGKKVASKGNSELSSSKPSKTNSNYAALSSSNLSLSSIVSSEVDIKRSNSVFDELMSSFEDDGSSSFPSLKSFLKHDSMSMSSPIQGTRQRNGQVSDEELSSPDSYKRRDHGKLSADSAYSSLNRKYSNHGRSTNDVVSRLEEETPPRRRDAGQATAKHKLSKFCHECGSKFPETAKFCCECGIKRLAL